MHECESLIDHPSTTTTTKTTTLTTNNDKHNNDAHIGKYVVLSPLLSTFDVDDSTTTIDIESNDKQSSNRPLDPTTPTTTTTVDDVDDNNDDDDKPALHSCALHDPTAKQKRNDDNNANACNT